MSMQKAYPVTSNNVTVLAPRTLLSGALSRVTCNLTNTVGAYVTAYITKGGTVQPNSAIGLRIRRLDSGSAGVLGGAGFNTVINLAATNTGTVTTTVVNKDAAVGASHVGVTAVGAIAAGDMVVITNATYTTTEIKRVARVIKTAASQIVFDSPTVFAHGSTAADKVRNKAEYFGPTWLPGGAVYEVIVDNAAATAGDAGIVWAKAQKYVYDRADY